MARFLNWNSLRFWPHGYRSVFSIAVLQFQVPDGNTSIRRSIMQIFLGDFEYQFIWLDGDEMPVEALDAANGAMANCLQIHGEHTLCNTAGCQEHDGLLRSTKEWYFSVIESDGTGRVTMSLTKHKELQKRIYAQAKARYFGKQQKAN
jgi:hypothetical protein